MVNNVNFSLRGQDPLGLSDGEGVVGVSTTPIKTKKKIQKKIREVDGGGQNLPYTNWKSMEKAVKKNRKLFFL